MNFDKLSIDYLERQRIRVEEIRKRISLRSEVVTEGRIVPSDADLAQGLGRRLPLTVLFIDIVNSTGRPAETLEEQDQILRIYDLFFTEAIRVAEEYGGEVEKNTGDGLMSYFADSWIGSPEPSVKRALASVLTLKYVTEQIINPILAFDLHPGISFRAGLDYGRVTIAQIGAARRFGNRVAIGLTASLANKMLAGVDDSIIIGESVYQTLPSDWQQFCELQSENSGFTYKVSQEPYRYFKYNGRWNGAR